MGDERGAASPLVHLDLDNFDSKEARRCRYVLTSPRSLESCARLGVRPADLLQRSLSEFVRAHRDAPLRSVALLYEVYERERRRRVRLCREERRKVMEEGALETVPEHAAESQISEPRAGRAGRDEAPRRADKRPGQRGTTRGRSLSVERRGAPRSRDCIATSFSLGDLRHSAATSQRLERLEREIRKERSVTVPHKDRKIAALMLARREEEELRLRRSQREEELREEAQRHEALQRAVAERRRRQELERGALLWQEALEARRRQRQREEARLAAVREQERVTHEERQRRLAEEQGRRRRERAEAARREAGERKRCQQRLLEEQERQERAGRQQELRLALDKELRAGRSRRSWERAERRRRRIHNQQQMLRHVLLTRELEEEARALELRMRSALERRLERSRGNHAQCLQARHQELRERAAHGEELKERARTRAGQQARQREQQRRVLAELCEQRMERAAQRVGAQRRERAQEARRANAARERAHRLLRERLREEEEGVLRQRLGHIARKERRREQLQRVREEVQEKGRRLARASFHMRERLKEESSSSRSFQQMALEAQIAAALDRIKL
ncbi:coiled-coil domain-containing protein 177 [Scleropages formosus]|nr:coiled-coil domain-containing protein 177-like [Scleropages formosus]